MRFRKHVEGDKNWMLFRECIYPIGVPGSMDRHEARKRNEGNHRGMPNGPVQDLRHPSWDVLLFFRFHLPDEFVSPAFELAAPRVK